LDGRDGGWSVKGFVELKRLCEQEAGRLDAEGVR
jgi:hypothetical protein